MTLNFPTSPSLGALYPDPAETNVPQYQWDGTAWKAGALPTVYAAPFDALAYNGMQINGSMDVTQERAFGVGYTGASGYICDGWTVGRSGTMATTGFLAAADVKGYRNQLAVTVQTAQTTINAGDYLHVTQGIEGYRFARLAWGSSSAQPLSIGFWSGHTRIGTYTGNIRNAAGNRSYAFTYTQNVSAVPEFKTITIPGCPDGVWNTDHTAAVLIGFTMACGTTYLVPTANTWTVGNYLGAPGQINGVAATSDVFRITGVIILPGIELPSSARAPFIMRPFDQELPTCQRYYYRTGTFDFQLPTAVTAGVTMRHAFPHPVTMRAAPTMSFMSQTLVDRAAGSLAANAPTVRMAAFQGAVATGSGIAAWTGVEFYCDARL